MTQITSTLSDAIEFDELVPNELEFVQRMIARGGVHPFIRNNQDGLGVAILEDREQKFTTILIKVRVANNAYIFTGVSKRMTYGPAMDVHNEETGFNIALARAMRNRPVVV